MTDAQEAATPQENIDPAALAFEELRQEVALTRRAVAGLAAERAAIEIPDYSETLGKIVQSSAVTAKNLKALAEHPILHATVQDWADAIVKANTPARHASQNALANLHSQLSQVADDMAASLRKARTADSQRQWLLWTFGGGLLAGVLLGIFAILPLVHAL
ncbi:MAG: hypothetical protein BGO51_15660 [Rhodospirillales bacterium 69-11]|nr:MAG: hypothetical protein BGO51_15660 [Rhodospirillales bacterium 69-11]